MWSWFSFAIGVSVGAAGLAAVALATVWMGR
jgi:hypothetical protein